MPASRIKIFLNGCGVLLILLVIAAVIYPVFTRVRCPPGPCNVNNCLSNERQIGLALLQYTEDWNGKFPCGVRKEGIGWAGTVQNYIKSTSVFRCELDPTQPTAPAVVDSYALNANLQKGVHSSVSPESFGTQATTVMLFEITDNVARVDLLDEGASAGAKSFSAVGNGTDGSLRSGDGNAKYATGYLGKRPISPAYTQFDAPTGRHVDGANFLLGDGHVRYLLPDKVSTGTDARNKKDGQTGGIVGNAAGTENKAFVATFSTR